MRKRAVRDRQLERAAGRFIAKFEHVFGDDWEHSKACLSSPEVFVEPGHTFINPGQVDEGHDWDSRRVLLEAYRDLAELLMERGRHPDQIDPDELDL